MDSNESLTYGVQEGSAHNGQFGGTCYHLFGCVGPVRRCRAVRPAISSGTSQAL
jgi:hypothetical protein